jgi:hypothetical protein
MGTSLGRFVHEETSFLRVGEELLGRNILVRNVGRTLPPASDGFLSILATMK